MLFLHSVCRFIRNCSQFVILWQLRRLDWFVNKLFGTWYTLLLCPFISEPDSSMVESSLRNPWIGGSNPSRNYTSFSVSRRINPFSSENCSFCTLKERRWNIGLSKFPQVSIFYTIDLNNVVVVQNLEHQNRNYFNMILWQVLLALVVKKWTTWHFNFLRYRYLQWGGEKLACHWTSCFFTSVNCGNPIGQVVYSPPRYKYLISTTVHAISSIFSQIMPNSPRNNIMLKQFL